MPDIDLDPQEYAERDPKTGRLKRDMSPRWHRNWLIVPIIALIWIWWNRDAVSPSVLFGGTAIAGFCAGGFFYGWLRNIY